VNYYYFVTTPNICPKPLVGWILVRMIQQCVCKREVFAKADLARALNSSNVFACLLSKASLHSHGPVQCDQRRRGVGAMFVEYATTTRHLPRACFIRTRKRGQKQRRRLLQSAWVILGTGSSSHHRVTGSGPGSDFSISAEKLNLNLATPTADGVFISL
jgi:hypothetical protein